MSVRKRHSCLNGDRLLRAGPNGHYNQSTVSSVELPLPIANYFAAKGGPDAEETLACFTEDATVWDKGEDLELKGATEIRKWMTGTVAGYKLTSEVISGGPRGEEFVVVVVVSGDFPGSPYKFEYKFKLKGDKIAELAIDPIGSLAEVGKRQV